MRARAGSLTEEFAVILANTNRQQGGSQKSDRSIIMPLDGKSGSRGYCVILSIGVASRVASTILTFPHALDSLIPVANMALYDKQ